VTTATEVKTNGKVPKGTKVATPAETGSAAISIQRIERRTVLVPVIGTAPLIVHAWSAKAKQIMLDAQQGRKKQKTIRDPEGDFQESIYRMADGSVGFPAAAFKSAVVGGARFYDKSSVLALVDAGGTGDGVGEWRPEKGGTFGTFQVNDELEIVEVAG